MTQYFKSVWCLCTVSAILIVVAMTVVGANEQAAKPPTPPQLPSLFGGKFTLIDHQGRVRTDRGFPGKYLLVNFGYSKCADICPTGLATMAAAIDVLGPLGDRVQPLFITVDPERDTPQRLRDYVLKFHPRFIGLTGSETQIRSAAKVYRVHRSKVIVEGEEPGNYLANHTSLTYLMDPDGEFITLFTHGAGPEFMAEALRRHIGLNVHHSGRTGIQIVRVP